MIDIELTSGEVITATDNHPFWELNTKEWITADELTNSSILLNINDKNTTIKSLKHYAKNKKVYNLTVNNFHTYFVGVSGVLGHNAGCSIFGAEKSFNHLIKKGLREEQANNLLKIWDKATFDTLDDNLINHFKKHGRELDSRTFERFLTKASNWFNSITPTIVEKRFRRTRNGVAEVLLVRDKKIISYYRNDREDIHINKPIFDANEFDDIFK